MTTVTTTEASDDETACWVERTVYTKVDSKTIKDFTMFRITCEYRICDVGRVDRLSSTSASCEVLDGIIAAITASGIEVDHLLSTLLSRRKINALSITPPPNFYGKRGVKHMRHAHAAVFPVKVVIRRTCASVYH
jgi:hypothetical protein